MAFSYNCLSMLACRGIEYDACRVETEPEQACFDPVSRLRQWTTLERTIHHHLAKLLAQDTSLDEFVDWLVGATWSVHGSASNSARELVYAIELALAEASDGLLTPEELRSALRALSEQSVLDVAARS